tara:strand:+ start:57 stop:677 length:621 start_codon:yes stop_codon:yes gene_type:complete
MDRTYNFAGWHVVKARKCYQCKEEIPVGSEVTSQLKSFCSVKHLIDWAKSEQGKKKIKKAYRKETKERKDKLKTRSEYMKEAQAAFNAYIRLRDSGKPCVSCGASQGDMKYGGNFDAGHYRSVGSASHCRFHLLNCHAQCKKCNNFLSGNVVEYRKELILRIGQTKTEKLENYNDIKKYDIPYLQRIKLIFRKRKRLYDRFKNYSL